MKDSYLWGLHGMDKGPFFVLIFSFRQAIARPVLRFCGLERFCKMHETVYSPMHEAVYGRFHRLFSMHDVVYGPMHGSVYAFRSKLMHEVVYTHLQKPMHEVVYDFFGAPATGHNRSFRAVCRWQAARPAARQQKRRHNMPPFRCITIYAIKPYTFLATCGTCASLRFNKSSCMLLSSSFAYLPQ